MNKTIFVDSYLRQEKPFLFVDRATLAPNGEKIIGYRYFDASEKYFSGHFPDEPIVPGVLLLEAMAQLCRLWMNYEAGQMKQGYLSQIHTANFNRQVRPGDEIRIEARRIPGELTVNLKASHIDHFKCAVYVGETRCSRAEIVLHQMSNAD
ncbi:3-hydroxyacyl-ACP dehydratase FabZ family protein [Undibacterium sp. RuRC25W]|uniref:3-hydroxyacyl-ACP dehydratase FabZ family protein n=1 Tax=Undibacterium sp. RuRC25W TaxID=3413047 RepID=UPI003BF24ADB